MIKLKQVQKSYQDFQVLKDVNLNLFPGLITLITGKSGSGKTTLLNIISGLDKQDQGSIEYPKTINKDFKKIGFIFQQPILIDYLTVEENILLGQFTLKNYHNQKRRLNEIMKQLDLEQCLLKRPSTLSGGQKQRVKMAQTMLKDPLVIIGDEPTSALDYDTSQLVLSIFKEFALKNKYIVIVSHDLNLIDYSDCHYHLNEGQLECKKTNQNYQTSITTSIETSNWVAVGYLFKKYLKFNRKNIFKIIFALALTLSGIFIVLGLNSGINDYIKTNFKDTLKNTQSVIYELDQKEFSPTQIAYLNSIKDISYGVEVYNQILSDDYYQLTTLKPTLIKGNDNLVMVEDPKVKSVKISFIYQNKLVTINSKVSGYHDQKGIIYINDDLFKKELKKQKIVYKPNIAATPHQLQKDQIKQLEAKHMINDPEKQMLMMVMTLIDMFFKILLMIISVGLIIMITLVNMLFKTNIDNEKRHIAIMKLNGLTKFNIFNYYLLNNGFIVVASALISMVNVFVLMKLINYILNRSFNLTILKFELNSYLVVIISFGLLIIVSSSIHVLKAMKSNPLEVINE